ncbi:unnamed protein product [Fusarium venenatum]|uniref:Uncharacterized protein n=1 Tax=Fusarium venenatum TaxID=56646 RepID=A0A2L2T5G8_9HYPO|nr:uncharacterized protein FVRRES_07419 [Fusarium venenatum]CEI62983.1 unnamed protein product [Fusarium venenatum]
MYNMSKCPADPYMNWEFDFDALDIYAIYVCASPNNNNVVVANLTLVYALLSLRLH